MKNFAMLYKMKEALQDFRAAYNQLDPEWQKWLKQKIFVEDIFQAHYKLENIELDILNIKPFEIEGLLDIRQQERGED